MDFFLSIFRVKSNIDLQIIPQMLEEVVLELVTQSVLDAGSRSV